MEQIAAGCMPPAQLGDPVRAIGIVLIEQMILAGIKDRAIRVIEPAFWCGKVKLGPERLIVAFLRRKRLREST